MMFCFPNLVEADQTGLHIEKSKYFFTRCIALTSTCCHIYLSYLITVHQTIANSVKVH